jgi:AcrR family transcriptional regulator
VARTAELLWRGPQQGGPGPKPALDLDRITAAAVAIADADGLRGLSMRQVAARLGVGTMSLYRYVPGKSELVDLMVDLVNGEVGCAADPTEGWRAGLEQVARESLDLYRRHTWLLEVFPGRPPMGPGVLGRYDRELRAVDGIGLSDPEMDLVLDLVRGYVRGAAAVLIDASGLIQGTGLTDQEWWDLVAPTLEREFTPERYPLATRVGEAATAIHQGTFDPELAFEFGLDRVLDGIGAFIASRPEAR